MANERDGSALRYLRVLFQDGKAAEQTDGQLLERFATKRGESAESARDAELAFATLIDRHGAMVWGVCRRVLRDSHEAEDAFQATFLVLVRKADVVRVDDSLGRWLHGVALRVSLRARANAERRESITRPVPACSGDDPSLEAERGDLESALSEELDRLPEKLRSPIELCYLEGMTYDQAAQRLNWPAATVKSRLTRARLRLRERLSRRGVATTEAGLASALPNVPRPLRVRSRGWSAPGPGRPQGRLPAGGRRMLEERERDGPRVGQAARGPRAPRRTVGPSNSRPTGSPRVRASHHRTRRTQPGGKALGGVSRYH